MPIYEYGCKSCHREFEYQQRMSDPEKTVCEACGGELERLISRTAFQLKGSGWYKDLYSSSKPAETKTESTTESKPAESKPAESKPADSGSSTSTSTSTKEGSGGGSIVIIDGKAVAARVRGEVAIAAGKLRERQIAPTLAVVLVGDDPASAVYVRSKTKAAREANVDVRDHKLAASTTQA